MVIIATPISRSIIEANVIESLGILTTVGTIQTEDEYNATPEENADADISYLEFVELYSQASEELANDLTRLNLASVSDTTTKRGMAYLIADYTQIAQPNWDAAKVQYNQDSYVYRHANRKGSSHYYNYLLTLDNALKASTSHKARKAGVLIT